MLRNVSAGVEMLRGNLYSVGKPWLLKSVKSWRPEGREEGGREGEMERDVHELPETSRGIRRDIVL